MRKESIDTRWEGSDLLVLRSEREIDRIAAGSIQRVILACRGGDAPSNLRFAIVQTDADHILLPAASGIAMGFDRLAMLVSGARRIADVQWLPWNSAPW